MLFSSVNFDVDNKGTFYVTYEADSLIYVYNDDFEIRHCYGFAGQDMDLNYKRINAIKEIKKITKRKEPLRVITIGLNM